MPNFHAAILQMDVELPCDLLPKLQKGTSQSKVILQLSGEMKGSIALPRFRGQSPSTVREGVSTVSHVCWVC